MPACADPGSESSKQPDYAKNPARAIKPEFLVLLGVCTHLGCAPQNRFTPGASADGVLTADWPGGFFCPCHGSKFDLSGPRVQGRAGTDQPGDPAVRLRRRHTHLVIGLDQAKGVMAQAKAAAAHRWRPAQRGSAPGSTSASR